MKFTPGEWEADLTRVNGHCGISIDSGDVQIATVYLHEYCAPNRPGGEINQPVNQASVANARIIAQSPLMYEALKGIMDALPTNRDWLDPVLERMAKEAIAKAGA